MTQRGFKRFGETLAHVVTNLETVNNDINGMLVRLGQFGQRVDFVDFSVDAQANEALRAQFAKEFKLLALAIGNDGGQNHQPGFGRQCQHVIDHLRDGLRIERLLMFRTVGCAGPGKEQTQIVVDFGDSADGRTRVVAGRFLFDGNRRRQPFDQIDIRLVDTLQELTGIGRQRFDIASLPLGIKRVKSQRRFARTGEAGNHDQPVAWQIKIDVFKVVRACAANSDFSKFIHWGALPEG